jgi:undecaprenyl-diphosphatase
MPADLTIFAAKYLIFIDAVLAAVVLVWLLARRSRLTVLQWFLATVVMVVLSYIFAHIGAAMYSDPRPFTQDHVKPLITHAADNGFPSDHALLAAAIVAAVLLAAPLWIAPFVILGFLVDWARVGAGIHHVQDVAGSTLFVALATLIAFVVVRLALPYLPASWGVEGERDGSVLSRERRQLRG